MIRLIAGLGNPGPEYAATRHNAGFWFVDEVADRLKISLSPERSYFGLVARVNRPEGPVWLLEPMTFMNLSGRSVAAKIRSGPSGTSVPATRIVVPLRSSPGAKWRRS